MFWFVMAILTFLIFYTKRIYKWVWILIKTIPRDIRMVVHQYSLVKWLQKCKNEDYSIGDLLSQRVKEHPNKVAFYFEDKSLTFKEVESFSNKIANYFKQEGFQSGDTIALLLENCIHFPAIWIGLSKNGIVTALVNTNLVKDSLVHSLQAAQCGAIIFGTSHADILQEVLDKLPSKKLYQFNDAGEGTKIADAEDLYLKAGDCSEEFVQSRKVSSCDPLMYIYTSGTTGLPKAAMVTHIKYISVASAVKEIARFTKEDVIYTPLPLYHGAGTVIGVGQTLVTGMTTVLRKKFSASNYFKDCAKYNVTIGQYIGELCRYILAVKEDSPIQHSVRMLAGNGLKPQIWRPFVERFGVRVIEFYGATESVAYLANIDGIEGSIGFIPRYLKWAFGMTTIKCNESTGEPIRNKQGYCIECNPYEPGLFIANANKNKTSIIKYDGYKDQKASEKKLLRNVFSDGDSYFNTGDILDYDEFGNFYFKDRVGDTFRWKGENVSTSEIEAVISDVVELNDVVVYGVEVPHTDGKAGMAAIVHDTNSIDINSIEAILKRHLPSYAIPIFLRITNSIPLTGTFKMQKFDYKEQGYNINTIKDDLYFYQAAHGKYVPLSRELYADIQNGRLRL